MIYKYWLILDIVDLRNLWQTAIKSYSLGWLISKTLRNTITKWSLCLLIIKVVSKSGQRLNSQNLTRLGLTINYFSVQVREITKDPHKVTHSYINKYNHQPEEYKNS